VRNKGATSQTAAQQQELWLKSATAWQKKPRITTLRAGTDIVHYLEQYLGTSKKTQPVAEAFIKVIGTEWSAYCRPDKYEKGVLYIHCSPGPCLHQLRTEQTKIIEMMKTLCPSIKLRALRFTIKN
jgi:hypothetical protein